MHDPISLIAFRARIGSGHTELARWLEINASRLADFELGHSRGKNPQPAPIPKLVELACVWLGKHEVNNRPLTQAERAALWRDTSYLSMIDAAADDSREALYQPPRRLLVFSSIRTVCGASLSPVIDTIVRPSTASLSRSTAANGACDGT